MGNTEKTSTVTTPLVFRGYNPTGQWMAEFFIDQAETYPEPEEQTSAGDTIQPGEWKDLFSMGSQAGRYLEKNMPTAKDRKSYLKKVERFLLDNVRVLRVSSIVSKNDPERPFMPRLIAAKIRLNSLKILLPDSDGKKTFLSLKFTSAYTTDVILDNPFMRDDVSTEYDFAFIITSIFLKIPFGTALAWPAFIDKTNAKVLLDVAGKTTEVIVDPATLLGTYLKLPKAQPNDELQLHEGGVIYAGSMPLPWKNTTSIPGEYQLIRNNTTGNFSLVIKNNPDWKNALLSYQDEIVNATDELKNEFNAPLPGSPSAGFIASVVKDEVQWTYHKNTLHYDPGASLFELEFRGSAGGTSRVLPDAITLQDSGKKIVFSSGMVSENDDYIDYYFERSPEKNAWKGSFDLIPEPGALQMLLEISGQQPSNGLYTFWVLTPQGPFATPVQRILPENEGAQNAAAVSQSIIRGVLRLSVVPWIESGIQGILFPSLEKEKNGSLLLTGAKGVTAEFEFSSAEKLRCEKIHVRILEPFVRMEEVLAVYLPDKSVQYDMYKPPKFPLPLANNTGLPSILFYGLSFIRSASSGDQLSALNWQMNLNYKPGINAGMEGSWNTSCLSLIMAQEVVSRAMYWFHPDNALLIPSLPYQQDPSQQVEKVSKNRLFIPFEPLANKTIDFQFSENWYTPFIKHGTFIPASQNEDHFAPDFFEWSHLLLPGISITLISNRPVVIINGRLADGSLLLKWRNDLPLLDEIQALMTSAKKKNEALTENVGMTWWTKLIQMKLLSAGIEVVMTAGEFPINAEKIIEVFDTPIEVKNLIGIFSFKGLMNVALSGSTASLFLKDAQAKSISLITQDELLKGPTAKFRYHNHALVPVSDGTYDTEMTAAAVVPFPVKRENEAAFMDQHGNYFSPVREEIAHRKVTIYAPEKKEHIDYYLWSLPSVELKIPGAEINLYFKGIPLSRDKKGTWQFNNDDTPESVLLKEFSWGNIGPVYIDQFLFQPFQLEQLLVETSENQMPGMPLTIVMSGVLHFIPSVSSISDMEKQQVTATFIRSNQAWLVASLNGRIFWPLYQQAPDIGKAKESDLRTIYPFIESPVSFSGGKIVFGNSASAPQLVFPFLQKIWSLDLLPITISADSIEWQITNPGETIGLYPFAGKILLDKKKAASSAIDFRITVNTKIESFHLADVEFRYTLSKDNSQINITNFRLLQRNKTLLLTDRADQIFFNAGQLVITINEKPGFRRDMEPLCLLPGWPLDPAAGLCGYLQLDFTGDPARQRIRQTPVSSFFMALESAVKAPGTLHTAFEFKQLSGSDPEWYVRLTGQLSLNNVFRWKTEEEEVYSHRVTFTFLNALLPGNQLEFSPVENIIFDLAFIENHERGLSGMIEIPCMASHRFTTGSGDQEVIKTSWTAPQLLRLAHPKSAVLKIFGLHSKNNDPMALPNGFYGETGIRFKEIVENRRTVVFDAGEVFWMRPVLDIGNAKAEAILWQENDVALKGIPSTRLEFSGKNEQPWIRVPIPFIQDSGNNFNKELQSGEAFQRLTLIVPTPSFSGENNLIRKDLLDMLSLEYPVLYSAEKIVFQNVEVNAAAHEHLLPYMWLNKEFEPGWMVFDNQYGNENTRKITLLRKKMLFDGWDRIKKPYYNEFQLQLKESGEYTIEMKIGSRWKETLMLIYARSDNYSIVSIPYISGNSKNAAITATINLDKKDKKIVFLAMRHHIDVDEVHLIPTREKVYESKVAAKDLESGSREGINQIVKPVKNKKTPPPIGEDDWIEYAVTIPADDDYSLDIVIDTAADNTEFEIKQSGKYVGEIELTRDVATDLPLTIRIPVSLKKGNRKLRFSCSRGFFRLLWFQISLYRQRIALAPFEASVSAVKQLIANPARTFLAATEIIPSANPGKLPWQRIMDEQGRTKPYFRASPLTGIYRSGLAPVNDDLNFRIVLDIILAGKDNWKTNDRGIFNIFASSQFIIGIKVSDSWEKILFEKNENNLVRKRVIDWILQFQQRIPAGSTAILRARTVYPSPVIPTLKYFVLNTGNQPGTELSVPVIVSAKYPLAEDLHYENSSWKQEDTLMRGPDYLGGKVYYVPLDWFEFPLPVLPENPWDEISSFTADKDRIKAGDPLKLTWKLKSKDPGSKIFIEVKDQDLFYYPEKNEIIIYPVRSSVFILNVLSPTNVKIEQAVIGVSVKAPVSGSGIGISYQLAGTAPGPLNHTRRPLRKDSQGFHRWVELTRDVEFLGLTRSDAVSKNETGWTLPSSRKLKTDENFDPSVLSPFLSTRASILFTGGRAGSLNTIRNSFLNQDPDNLLRRTNSMIFQLRYPRPVPLHASLYPAPSPLKDEPAGFEIQPTCIVRELEPAHPFHYRELKWQDPLYNRKLQAAQQDTQAQWGKLLLDRKVYSGCDLFYPELNIEPEQLLLGGTITLTWYIERVINGLLKKIAEMTVVINNDYRSDAIVKEVKAINIKRYVFEIGLNQSLADMFFNLDLKNLDQLTVLARHNKFTQVMRLKAMIRTDEEVWSQPQNAYAILRQKSNADQIAIAAFGWLQKPKIVKRADRFEANSWTGTFQFTDTFLLLPQEENVGVNYEVRNISPYGEQSMDKPFEAL